MAKKWWIFDLAIIAHFILHYKIINIISSLRSSGPEVFRRKVVIESLQNSQENTSARVSFLIKGVLALMFSCNFFEIFKYTFSHRTPLVADSVLCWNSFLFLLYYFFWVHFFELPKTFKTFLLQMWTYVVLRA